MIRTTLYGTLTQDEELNENEKAMLYIKKCAELVGLKVIEGETAFSITFMAEIMKRLRKEPSGDLISRDYLLSIANKDGAYGYVSAHEIINAPSVNPQEPKTGNLVENLCDLCTNKACEFQFGIQRSKCDFYIPPMPHLEPDNCGNYVVQQEPKTGHWIPTYGNVKCSVCGSVKDSREVGKATHYCDFCGAKMIEKKESEVQE